MNILILDDEEKIRDGIAKRIDKYGFYYDNLYKAIDYNEANKIIDTCNIDLAFIDINMPFMNGLDFIQLHINKNISFVIISGYDKFEYAKKAIELGVVQYLLKPIDKQEFISVVEKIYKQKNMELNKLNDTVNKIINNININFVDKEYNLQKASQLLKVSNSYICRILKNENLFFNDILNCNRLEYAKDLIDNSDKLFVSEIAEKSGFSSQQYFNCVFKKYYDCTPSQMFRRQK